MSQYFHDIGVFLHFQGDTQLNKTVFLNPNWVHKRFTSCSTIRCLTSNMADSAVKMPLLSGTKRSMQIFAMSCSAYWESFSSHTKLMGQVDTLCRKSCLRQALHILGIRLEISTCNIPTTSLCREESYRSSQWRCTASLTIMNWYGSEDVCLNMTVQVPRSLKAMMPGGLQYVSPAQTRGIL